MNELWLVIPAIILMYIIIRGAAKAFRKNFWLALFMFLVLSPLFFVWSFFEGVFGE